MTTATELHAVTNHDRSRTLCGAPARKHPVTGPAILAWPEPDRAICAICRARMGLIEAARAHLAQPPEALPSAVVDIDDDTYSSAWEALQDLARGEYPHEHVGDADTIILRASGVQNELKLSGWAP